LGGFDHEQFLYRLQSAGYTEDSFVQIEREDLSRNQLLDAIHAGVRLAPGYARMLFNYVNERRAADYVVVPKTAAGTPPQPADADRFGDELRRRRDAAETEALRYFAWYCCTG